MKNYIQFDTGLAGKTGAISFEESKRLEQRDPSQIAEEARIAEAERQRKERILLAKLRDDRNNDRTIPAHRLQIDVLGLDKWLELRTPDARKKAVQIKLAEAERLERAHA
ncbi:hypothetical protein F7649_10645 [Tenacibaculum piscium]|nr:hypothetical protein [Tenacibaculum piscium]MBE7671570.1 hypothetical protein [Tenacibaculum piscium]